MLQKCSALGNENLLLHFLEAIVTYSNALFCQASSFQCKAVRGIHILTFEKKEHGG